MIVEYNEKYNEDIKSLLLELQQYLSDIDKEGYNIVGDNYKEEYFKKTMDEVNRCAGRIHLFEEDGKIVGLVVGVVNNDEVERFDFKAPKRGRITELVVAKEYRGRHIGKQLLDSMKDYLKKIGCKKIMIAVFGYNEAAIRFYERNGYHMRMMDMIEDNYECRIASRDELFRRWDYLVKIHNGDAKWVRFKDNALRQYDEGSTITYFYFLNGEVICEATAYIKESAFIGDIDESSGLLSESMVYLAAFRTNREYEGQGYFSRLYKFLENDLRGRGYTELSVGVEQSEVRNKQIYAHLGFIESIKTIQQDGEFVEFYKKVI